MNRLAETTEVDTQAIEYEIKKHIERLIQKGCPGNRLKIAIPRVWKGILEYNKIVDSGVVLPPPLNTMFGVEVVEGYNDQICVFDTMALPFSDFAPIIEIKKFTVKP
ncbi:hypothetical protein EGI11_03200 [Chryseobacterium sp. H3056]|uniref:Uncharacterized protein n=1 Tax=Kaistella daneshvariae TaxID=2487074 RepID=A0A3N0WXF3_9FLAO|nr:hypothetical protein [Kaistella daneshvariae]ROI09778.1 hypothetical protein EGI11_03200 [Kaistella daneshvariae]